MDFDAIARELLVALRGRRSQVAWSRRLGYKSNVAYSWESGRRWPNASETLRAAERSGVDLRASLVRFFGNEPAWLAAARDLAAPSVVARFLEELRGSVSISDLARRASLSRYSVTRWLSGATQPRLPDLLRLVEAASLRLVDLVTCLVPPASMPSVKVLWERLESRRRGAFELPWTQAVLRVLELEAYLATPEHDDGWVAERLGIAVDEALRCRVFLEDTGQAVRVGRHLRHEPMAVDTRRAPEVGRHLKAHWTHVGEERIRAGAEGQFSYNVFTVSEADLERIRKLHLAYFQALRGIVAESRSSERVVVANVQLFPLD